jgi:hypothetical protein
MLSPAASGKTIHVPGDHATIQNAVNAAVTGDEVHVAPGTYVENIDFNGKAIRLLATGGPAVTIVDGGNPVHSDFGSVVSFLNNEGPDTLLEGFTLTNGKGSLYTGYPYDYYRGGGILCIGASPTLINNVISFNDTYSTGILWNRGGGMCCCAGAAPRIENCLFADNMTYRGGGGIYVDRSSPWIIGCAFQSNWTHGHGGGICNESDAAPYVTTPVIMGCTFHQNETYGCGAGMANRLAMPLIKDCEFTENLANNEGGGMYNILSLVTVTNCTFHKNELYNYYGDGAGMFNDRCSLTIEKCTFSENVSSTTSGAGGAMYNVDSYPNIKDCLFIDNQATHCGGMYNKHASPKLVRCVFEGNSGIMFAGALYGRDASAPEINDCTFQENRVNTGPGGAVFLFESSSAISNSVFTANESEQGGAVAFSNTTAEMTGCLISNNLADEGGGAYCSESSVLFRNCTVTRNEAGLEGGGIFVFNSIETHLTNCVLWEDRVSPNIPSEIAGRGKMPVILHSDVEGGYAGTGNIDLDPVFADEPGPCAHLCYNSPCRDAGHNDFVTKSIDIEGDPRITYGTVDMGADEFHNHLYCLGTFTPGGSMEGKFVGLPGSVPVDLFFASNTATPPLHTSWGPFYLETPWFMISIPAAIPATGILEIPAVIPASIPAPYDICLQALIGNEPNSLTNLYVLEVR